LFDRSRKRVFVSLWNKSSLAIVDLGEKKVVGTWPTENHPTEMVQTSDGKTLYVACSNSTKVSVIETETGKCRETIVCSLYPQGTDVPGQSTGSRPSLASELDDS